MKRDQPDSWSALRWSEAGVVVLDQRRLPNEVVYLTLHNVEEVAQAIESMAIRGAPAIGCAAAMGIARAAITSRARDVPTLLSELEAAFERLAGTRPTGINLFKCLARMREALALAEGDVSQIGARLVAVAIDILEEDERTCRALGAAGVDLVPDNARILTHCNAGALATGGYGTALGVVRAAVAAGREVSVLAGETRPYLQGSRLTAWELARDGISVSVITDNMAGHLMQRGEVDLVVVGADRIAANGDVANKIGTYSLAVLAREHGLPFYVAAPCSSIDPETADGASIPIEVRGRAEVAELQGESVVPRGVPVLNPAFDVTPARLVSAIITERGLCRAPYQETLKALLAALG